MYRVQLLDHVKSLGPDLKRLEIKKFKSNELQLKYQRWINIVDFFKHIRYLGHVVAISDTKTF